MLQLGIYINILIDDYLRLKCHTCHKKIKFKDFFILQKKNYYCSKECYEFI